MFAFSVDALDFIGVFWFHIRPLFQIIVQQDVAVEEVVMR